MLSILAQPVYSVTDEEVASMQEKLQDALMKIEALEQTQKQLSKPKSDAVVTKSKKGLSIDTTGGGISVESGDAKFKIGGRLQLDYQGMNSAHQSANKSFGDLEWRRTRFGLSGAVNKYWSYDVTYDVASETDKANLDEGFIKYDTLDGVFVTVGKTKADMWMEQRTSSNWISTVERSILNLMSENVNYLIGKPGDGAGVKLGFYDKETQSSGAISVYDAYINDSNDDNSMIWFTTARLSVSPKIDDSSFYHIGVSYGAVDMKGQAANFASQIGVKGGGSTTLLDANAGDVTQWGLEAAYVSGPLSIQAEYIDNETDLVDGSKGYEWDGYYAQVAYTLTGETRGYKWQTGSFDKIKPAGPMGAWEVILRYEDLSLDDADEGTVADSKVDIDRTVFGLNWYATETVKFMANYSIVSMDNEVNPAGTTKDMDSFQLRAQYTF